MSISILRDVTAKVRPPRSLYLRWPFGHPLGEPAKIAQQFTVLYQAFQFLYTAEPGELRDLPYRWRREGYSIPAQLKLLREYARTHDFELVREFLDLETAKTTGRKQFGEMVRFFRENPHCRVAIVEKTDRLYRNFRDCVTLEDLEVEIHLPKEGQVISKDAKSQAKLVHGIQVVIARNYIENLREEVRKGMREKAEQRIYPSRPPLGYQNNKPEHPIEVDPKKAPLA